MKIIVRKIENGWVLKFTSYQYDTQTGQPKKMMQPKERFFKTLREVADTFDRHSHESRDEPKSPTDDKKSESATLDITQWGFTVKDQNEYINYMNNQVSKPSQ